MKINVYKITYHTITEATEDSEDGQVKAGCEISRTSPETVTVAAETFPEAVGCLPKRQNGCRNVVLSSRVLYEGIAFKGIIGRVPAAIVREQTKTEASAPEEPKADEEKPLDESLKEKAEE